MSKAIGRREAPTYRVEVEPPVAMAAQSAAYLPLERTPLRGFAPLVGKMRVQNQLLLSVYYAAKDY
ncbi:hypothetical protein [Nitrosococcus oceani]|uniref:hypothetical protein n=1 Tax=Nitrosococcus oceani TaxID=1229 RepID=UPI00030FA28D|nr:hypothetical protein [Nitrosococcus oceani]